MTTRFYTLKKGDMWAIIDTAWMPGKCMIPFDDYSNKSVATKICDAANKLAKHGKNPADAIPPRTPQVSKQRNALVNAAACRVKRGIDSKQPHTEPPTQPEPRPALIYRPLFPVPLCPAPRPVVLVPPPPRPRQVCTHGFSRHHGTDSQGYFAQCLSCGEKLRSTYPMPPPPAPRPVAAMPAPPAPQPRKPRYESKTDLQSRYHIRERSTVASPVELVKRVCADNLGKSRKQVIAMCLVLGVNASTAATQYSLWNTARRAGKI